MAHKERHSGGHTLGFINGVMMGAAGMYVLDPDRGRRRRATARDKAVLALREVGDAVDVTARDLSNRARGVAAEAWATIRRRGVPDVVVEERVRAKLGRVVSHPGSIEVSAQDGVVMLTGPILEAELEQALDAISNVRGVRHVENRLQAHKQAGDVPGLQGGSGRPGERFELMQENWAPATRFLVGVGGAMLALYGFGRRSVPGVGVGLAGVGLLARAATNLPARRLAGVSGRRAIDVQKTIRVNAPVDEVYRFWSNLENFPRFMAHVRQVEPTQQGGYRWTVDGPAGAPVSWNAVITEEIPNKVIAWRSEPGSLVSNAGIVRFDSEDGGTRVHVRLSYSPPAGVAGHAVAVFFGTDPKREMDDDLARFKSLIEVGKTTGRERQVRKEEIAS
jgi:uncharacterized membrane protein